LGLVVVAAALAAAPLPAARAQIPCGYEVTAVIQAPYCAPYGYPVTIPTAIGASGQVVGYYYSCVVGPSRPFRWTPGAGFVPLALPAGTTEGVAWGIDEQTGWIVGSTDGPGTDGPYATVWQSGVPLVLGTLPGGDYSEALASSNGQVVGRWGNEVTGPQHGFVWAAGAMTDLGPDLGTPNSDGLDVNEAGEVVGWMGTGPLLDERAYIWHDGRVTELGPVPGGFTSVARAISNAGQVVGSGLVIDPKSGGEFPRAFHWVAGQMTNLGLLPGFTRSAALDVADDGLVIGRLWGGIGNTGFVWYAGLMVDLNALIPPDAGLEILIAHSINNAGQVACDGWDQAAHRIGILLTPAEAPLGDLDCDGSVSGDDFRLLLDAWGSCPADSGCPADLDHDGAVGIVDLLALLQNWG
jgi:probable HAF family extracellular repeat protein